MLKKISTFPLKAYMTFTGFLQELKEDERGLSGVVVAVLLILVAVLAVILIWGFLSGWLEQLWTTITTKGSEIK